MTGCLDITRTLPIDCTAAIYVNVIMSDSRLTKHHKIRPNTKICIIVFVYALYLRSHETLTLLQQQKPIMYV